MMLPSRWVCRHECWPASSTWRSVWWVPEWSCSRRLGATAALRPPVDSGGSPTPQGPEACGAAGVGSARIHLRTLGGTRRIEDGFLAIGSPCEAVTADRSPVDIHAALSCKGQSVGTLKRPIGRDDGETQEQYVRRMREGDVNGYVKPVLPSLVEFYDRIATLEAQVAALQSKSQ